MKLLPVVAAALSLLACAKSPPDPPAGAAPTNAATNAATGAAAGAPERASTAAPAAADARTQQVDIRVLGLKGRAPAGAPAPTVGGDENQVLVAGGKFTARLWATKPTDPRTLADAQAFAKNFKPKNVQTETLGDGWSIAFETMGPSYIVIVGRELAGKGVHCEATEDSVEGQRAALAFCKSLAR